MKFDEFVHHEEGAHEADYQAGAYDYPHYQQKEFRAEQLEQLGNFALEHEEHGDKHDDGYQGCKYPHEGRFHKEGLTDEATSGPDKLHRMDGKAAVIDIEPYGIAYEHKGYEQE